MSEEIVTLALVDDHPIVIEGLKSLFAAHREKYKLLCFPDGKSLRSFLERGAPDLVLLDISLPDENGIDLCKWIKTACPETLVLGLSSQAAQSAILQMLQNGASGFLLKDIPAGEILDNIAAALAGDIVLSAEVRKILATPVAPVQQLPSLTRREKQLLHLLAQGKTTTAIAGELFLSRFTVDTYRKNLLQKFEVKNTSELLMLLVAHKMI